jgi:hypothetical protein
VDLEANVSEQCDYSSELGDCARVTGNREVISEQIIASGWPTIWELPEKHQTFVDHVELGIVNLHSSEPNFPP